MTTLAQGAAIVLRNCQIDSVSSTGSVQALTDAKAYMNERGHDVWQRRLWREYIILGTFSVPANTQRIALANIVVDSGFVAAGGLAASFNEIVSVREGCNPLMPEDATAINASDPDAWADTTTPVRFVNRGQSGIFLLGQFAVATTLSFMGKASWADLADGETWILDAYARALIAGATADMIRDNDRDDARANIRYQEYAAEILKLIEASEVQGANIKRVIPGLPWTNFSQRSRQDFNATGVDW